ncbi:MAG: hypothetical protein KatS3mg050_0050 [Litorilinea sp.]|nr:MAG: hypothetical protein KatS3mg050_0050 [Litorilinea sp.]
MNSIQLQRSSHLLSRWFSLGLALLLLLAFSGLAMAQDEEYTPDVQVSDMGIVDGKVIITRATMDGPGWVVIHTDADGSPGPVIGHAPLQEGENLDVAVEIDAEAATPLLFAMLHVDEGEVGTYEFPGPDVPARVGDNIVMARFSAAPVVEEVEVKEAEAKAEEAPMAPAAMPETGGSTSLPLIVGIVALLFVGLAGSVVVAQRRRTA